MAFLSSFDCKRCLKTYTLEALEEEVDYNEDDVVMHQNAQLCPDCFAEEALIEHNELNNKQYPATLYNGSDWEEQQVRY